MHFCAFLCNCFACTYFPIDETDFSLFDESHRPNFIQLAIQQFFLLFQSKKKGEKGSECVECIIWKTSIPICDDFVWLWQRAFSFKAVTPHCLIKNVCGSVHLLHALLFLVSNGCDYMCVCALVRNAVCYFCVLVPSTFFCTVGQVDVITCCCFFG